MVTINAQLVANSIMAEAIENWLNRFHPKECCTKHCLCVYQRKYWHNPNRPKFIYHPGEPGCEPLAGFDARFLPADELPDTTRHPLDTRS